MWSYTLNSVILSLCLMSCYINKQSWHKALSSTIDNDFNLKHFFFSPKFSYFLLIIYGCLLYQVMKSSNRLSLVLFLAAMIHTVNRLIKTIKQVPIRNERPSVKTFWDRRNMNKNLDKQFPLYKISHKIRMIVYQMRIHTKMKLRC